MFVVMSSVVILLCDQFDGFIGDVFVWMCGWCGVVLLVLCQQFFQCVVGDVVCVQCVDCVVYVVECCVVVVGCVIEYFFYDGIGQFVCIGWCIMVYYECECVYVFVGFE